MGIVRRVVKARELGLLIIVIIFISVMVFASPYFATRANIFGMLSALVTASILAGAMTVLFISGGFDLSVGSTVGMCAAAVALLIKNGVPIPISVFLTILLGFALGSIMGYMISYIDINPFIITLAGFLIIRSLHLIIAGGSSIGGLTKPFTLIAGYKIFNIPMSIIFAIVSLVLFDFLLRKNTYFRQNFYIGGNEKAASLIGINIKKVKLFNYVLTSTMAAIAGIFLASRFNNANIEGLPDISFQVITAVILGGASLGGGKGSIIGTVLGLLLLIIIQNGLVLFGLVIIWNKVAIGIVLIFIIILDNVLYKVSRKGKID